MEINAEGIGLVSGALTTLAFVPQVITLWRRAPESAPDISLATFLVITIGCIGWTIYGFEKSSASVAFWNIITVFLTTAIVTYKLKYG